MKDNSKKEWIKPQLTKLDINIETANTIGAATDGAGQALGGAVGS